MPTPVLPDPTVAARTALLAQPALTALVATRIYYAIPSVPTWPLLVLSLVDDDELRPETLSARVQVDVWGNGNTTQDVLDCKAIAAVIRSVARDLKGTWGAAAISMSVAGQIIPNPDTTSGRARFIVDLELHIN
jgi:hypothetical protein